MLHKGFIGYDTILYKKIQENTLEIRILYTLRLVMLQ